MRLGIASFRNTSSDNFGKNATGKQPDSMGNTINAHTTIHVPSSLDVASANINANAMAAKVLILWTLPMTSWPIRPT